MVRTRRLRTSAARTTDSMPVAISSETQSASQGDGSWSRATPLRYGHALGVDSLLAGSRYRTRSRARTEARLDPAFHPSGGYQMISGSPMGSDLWTEHERRNAAEGVRAEELVTKERSQLQQLPATLPNRSRTELTDVSALLNGRRDIIRTSGSRRTGKTMFSDWTYCLTDTVIDDWIACNPAELSVNDIDTSAVAATASTEPINAQQAELDAGMEPRLTKFDAQRLLLEEKTETTSHQQVASIATDRWFDPMKADMVSFFTAIGSAVLQQVLDHDGGNTQELAAPEASRSHRASLSSWLTLWNHLCWTWAHLWLAMSHIIERVLLPLLGIFIGLMTPEEGGAKPPATTDGFAVAPSPQQVGLLVSVERSVSFCLDLAERVLKSLQRFLIGLDSRLERYIASESLLYLFCSYHGVLLLFLIILVSVVGCFIVLMTRIYAAWMTRLVVIVTGIWGALHLFELDTQFIRYASRFYGRCHEHGKRLRSSTRNLDGRRVY
ncbi:hypothetical protein CCYA_CCYA09G2571 [Cyanidiococcus yangmingshanensis]|nr:hypothetical protein CCYA_CCYA09G2571 [Cyanidiococcus yangmingshanensis]